MNKEAGIVTGKILDTEHDKFAALKEVEESVNVERANWLYTLLADNGGSLTVKYIRAAGEQVGYSKHMMTTTRAFIKAHPNMPSVASVKIGKGWVWKLVGE